MRTLLIAGWALATIGTADAQGMAPAGPGTSGGRGGGQPGMSARPGDDRDRSRPRFGSDQPGFQHPGQPEFERPGQPGFGPNGPSGGYRPEGPSGRPGVGHRPERPGYGHGSRWQNRGGRWIGGWNAPGGWDGYRRPRAGAALPPYWRQPGFGIGDWAGYGLPPPPYGYSWSRYYDDAVLIDAAGSVYDMVDGVDWDDNGYDGRGYDRPPPATPSREGSRRASPDGTTTVTAVDGASGGSGTTVRVHRGSVVTTTTAVTVAPSSPRRARKVVRRR